MVYYSISLYKIQPFVSCRPSAAQRVRMMNRHGFFHHPALSSLPLQVSIRSISTSALFL